MVIEIYAACMSFVLVYVLKWHKDFRWMNRKPFACEVCMAGWLTLALSVQHLTIYTPFRMAAAMCLTIALTAILKKI